MKILILGGTGAMGKHLVKILSYNKNNKLYITSRSHHISGDNLQYYLGDAHNMNFIQSIVDKVDYDAIIDFMYYSTQEFTQHAQLLMQHTQQYFLLSSARVYADSITPITENSPRLLETSKDKEYIQGDEYSIEKCHQEDIIRSIGNNWTIIRPYITYSESRLQLGIYEIKDWLYRALKGRTIQLYKGIAQATTTLTYGYDVAYAISILIGKKEAIGQIYHITQTETIKWSDVLNIYINEIEKIKGIRPKILITNKDAYSNSGYKNVQILYDRVYNRIFDNSKIGKFVDVKEFKRADETLRNCLHDFLQDPYFPNIDWHRQALMDRLTGEVANPDEFSNKDDYKYYLYMRYTYNHQWVSFKQKIKKVIKYVLHNH